MTDTRTPQPPVLGHVHLRVSDLDRSEAFYRDVIGLDVQQRMGGRATFMSSDGYHHHLALNTWDSLGAGPAPRGHPGLFHTAFLYPDRLSLGVALKRAMAAGVEIEGASDHGVSEAIYFSDPDGNGVEIYRDRPRAEWPCDAAGNLAITSGRLNLHALLEEAEQVAPVPA